MYNIRMIDRNYLLKKAYVYTERELRLDNK